MDVIFVAVAIGFIAATFGFAYLCGKL